MARKKRFKALKAALRYLQPTGTDGDGQPVQAPANTQLKKYQDYLSGSINVEYPARPADSRTNGLTVKLIKLFGGEATDNLANAKMSNRSALAANMALAGIDAATLKWQTSGTANYDGEFVPARAHIHNIPPQSVIGTSTSLLTGRKYKTKAGKAYCYPFGTDAATDTYKKVCNAIKEKIKGGVAVGGNRSVSFTPEDLF